MIRGNNLSLIIVLVSFFFLFFIFLSENKITSSPLINLEELKPSFEETENEMKNSINEKQFKKKKEILTHK